MWLRLVPLFAVAAALSAQPARVVDDATFSLSVAGAPFGTESFKIVQRAGREGPEFAVQAARTIEGRVVRSALTTDSVGNLTSYSRTVTGANPGQLSARPAMNRLTVNEEGGQTSSRDYPVGPGTVILDADVIHSLYFVAWQKKGEVRFSVHFVDVTGRVAGVVVVTEVGQEEVALGSGTVTATRYSIGGGDLKREIWVDSDRRLVKVAHPARQLIGIRDLPPR
jgi:hypothetical protein